MSADDRTRSGEAEGQRSAAGFRWAWTERAREALTARPRWMEDVTPPEQLAQVLQERFGFVPSVLLDVQRELGGVTLDYRRNHTVDLVLYDTVVLDLSPPFPFGWEDVTVPVWFIDLQGGVHDGNRIYSSARQCIEWHVHFRHPDPFRISAELTGLFAGDLPPAVRALTGFLGVTLDRALSDARNSFWRSGGTCLTVNGLRRGGTAAQLHTDDPAHAAAFSGWCEAHRGRVSFWT